MRDSGTEPSPSSAFVIQPELPAQYIVKPQVRRYRGCSLAGWLSQICDENLCMWCMRGISIPKVNACADFRRKFVTTNLQNLCMYCLVHFDCIKGLGMCSKPGMHRPHQRPGHVQSHAGWHIAFTMELLRDCKP